MSQRVRALRGFNDVLPEDTAWWRGVLVRAQRVMDLYAYKEVRLPLMESTELFSRSVGVCAWLSCTLSPIQRVSSAMPPCAAMGTFSDRDVLRSRGLWGTAQE